MSAAETAKSSRAATFMIIGAQKAGTTSLFEHLRKHPDIFLPSLKETNFFIEEGNWHLGLDWYRSLYESDEAQAAKHRGDASPGYSMFPYFRGVPDRIADTLGSDVRLIYLVRDPVDRMRSSWVQGITDGTEHRPLNEALLTDTRYLLLSCYALQLRQYLARFDRSQLLVLRQEDYRDDPNQFMDRVLTFLDLAPGWRPSDFGRRYNTSEAKLVPAAAGSPRGAATASGRVRSLLHRSHAVPSNVADAVLDQHLADALSDAVSADVEALRHLVPDLVPWDTSGRSLTRGLSSGG